MLSHLEAAYMSYLAYDYEAAKSRLHSFSTNVFFHECLPLVGEIGVKARADIEHDLRALFGNKAVYDISKSTAAIHLHQKGWQILGSSYEFMSDPSSIPVSSAYTSGYLGVTFINHHSKQIVLAHRGTMVPTISDCLKPISASKANILADIEILKRENLTNIPAILTTAIAYVVQVIRSRNYAHKDYSISQTGHSLGGFLAEFCAAYVANPRPVLEDDVPSGIRSVTRLKTQRFSDAGAITFDSLGSRTFLNRFDIPSNEDRTINYVYRPNIANTANPHDGIMRQLNASSVTITPLYSSANVAMHISPAQIINFQEVLDTINSHSLANMISYFNKTNGEPRLYRTVAAWPYATNDFTYGVSPFASVDPHASQSQIIHGVTWGVAHSMTGGVCAMTHQRYGDIQYFEVSHTASSTSTMPFPMPAIPQMHETRSSSSSTVTTSSIPSIFSTMPSIESTESLGVLELMRTHETSSTFGSSSSSIFSSPRAPRVQHAKPDTTGLSQRGSSKEIVDRSNNTSAIIRPRGGSS